MERALRARILREAEVDLEWKAVSSTWLHSRSLEQLKYPPDTFEDEEGLPHRGHLVSILAQWKAFGFADHPHRDPEASWVYWMCRSGLSFVEGDAENDGYQVFRDHEMENLHSGHDQDDSFDAQGLAEAGWRPLEDLDPCPPDLRSAWTVLRPHFMALGDATFRTYVETGKIARWGEWTPGTDDERRIWNALTHQDHLGALEVLTELGGAANARDCYWQALKDCKARR